MISTRSGALVIDTVVCLTLAKWETVSGRFGGYLITLLLQPKLNTTLVSWLELVDFLHMPTSVQMVPTVAVRHFVSPIRGKKQFVAFG